MRIRDLFPLVGAFAALAQLLPEVFGSPWKRESGIVRLAYREGNKVVFRWFYYDAWRYKGLFRGKVYRKYNYPRAS